MTMNDNHNPSATRWQRLRCFLGSHPLLWREPYVANFETRFRGFRGVEEPIPSTELRQRGYCAVCGACTDRRVDR
jgi:hypothetical protein